MAIGEGIGGLAGGLAVLAGAAGEGGERRFAEAADVWRKLQASDFDYRSLSAPELEVLATAMPEVYEAVVPSREDIPQITGAPEARMSQLRALAGLEQIADEGMPLVDRLQAQEAQRSVADEAERARTDVLRSLAQRGQLGAGDELQAQLEGAQQAAELARGQGADLAQMAALRRLGGLEGAAGLAGSIRGQDVQEQVAQGGFTERFNELLSRLQTQAAADAARARERAQMYNVQTQQRVGESNPLLKYQTDLENLTRQNQLRGQQFQQELAKTQGLTGSLTNLGQDETAQQRARAEALVGTGEAAGGLAEDVFKMV